MPLWGFAPLLPLALYRVQGYRGCVDGKKNFISPELTNSGRAGTGNCHETLCFQVDVWLQEATGFIQSVRVGSEQSHGPFALMEASGGRFFSFWTSQGADGYHKRAENSPSPFQSSSISPGAEGERGMEGFLGRFPCRQVLDFVCRKCWETIHGFKALL